MSKLKLPLLVSEMIRCALTALGEIERVETDDEVGSSRLETFNVGT